MSDMKEPRESDSELEHWKSDEIHSGETRNRIRRLVKNAESEINKLDLEIARAQSLLNGLQLQRSADAARIDILRAAISPIKQIPVEILSKIFLDCREYHDEAITLPPKRRAYPWSFGHVCSRWRWVLWNTPDIWSSIKLGPGHLSERPSTTISGILCDIISRTSGLIALSVPRTHGDLILKVVRRFSHRFKSLDLELYKTQLHTFLDPISTSFCSLEVLTIFLCNADQQPPSFQVTSLQTATNLRKVSIDGGIDCYFPQLSHLPWSQLVDLELMYSKLPPSTLHIILSRCSSIVTCEVSVGRETLHLVTLQKDIILPKLKSLTFELAEDCYGDHFLQPFILKSLEQLGISWHHPTGPWPEKAVIQLIQRSGCHLKEINITRYPAFSEFTGYTNMAPLFQLTPSLIKLNIDLVVPPSTFKHILPYGLVPQIKSLTCHVFPEGFHAFLDFMEQYSGRDSRGILGGPQSATIKCRCSPGVDEAFDRFDTFVPKYEADGRSIHAHYA